MSQKTRAALTSGANSAYPDNTIGAITPLADRTQHIDEIDSGLLLAETIAQTVVGPVDYTGALTKSGAPVVTGLVTVNVEADFPTQDGTTITLEAGTVYIVTTSLSTAKRFVCENGAVMTALNRFGVTVTYTGTGNMFSGVDVNFLINDIGINAPNGTFFDFEDVAIVNSNVFWCSNVVGGSCAKFGRLDSMASLVITDTATTTDCTDGLTIEGTNWRVWRIQNSGFITTSTTFIGVDMGTATASAVAFGPITFVGQGAVGAVAYSGLANSGNIIAGNLARIDKSNFLGNVIPRVGLASGDIRWSYNENTEIPDTIIDAMVSLTGNATETVISTINTPVLTAGTWVCERESLFTCTTAGRLTLTSERDTVLPIDVALTIESASGVNIDVTAYIAINGTIVANSAKSNKVGGSDPRSISVLWQANLSENDYIELFVENNTGTINLIVLSAILRAR